MALTSLSDRLGTLPLMLAGPMLRRVTAKSVTVWVALQQTATVTITVNDNNNQAVMAGTGKTVAVGASLHIVAVTAIPKPPIDHLLEGIVYQYDLTFAVAGNPSMPLAQATGGADLAYAPLTLPSFALAPTDISAVRLLHGSCRMPHGDGPDALALLDVLIGQSASNAQFRPHQLMLTGDQIYADDVSDALLLLLTDAGDTLLNGVPQSATPTWEEVLPPDTLPARLLPPYWRQKPMSDAGFTSADLRSHLMSLGEYLAMYLFTWSDVLWPKDSTGAVSLPTIDDVMNKVDFGGFPDSAAGYQAYVQEVRNTAAKRQSTIIGDTAAIKIHHDTLYRVRKALANIPTSMIFDDHEITDDWNMTLGFCQHVYASQLGRRVVQNGLVAYALCQHWGNVPEQFANVTPAPPGFTLLQRLDQGSAASYDKNSAEIQKIVGVRNQPGQRTPDANSLVYNYTIELTACQVIVTDTRTWRSYPNGDDTTGDFLPVNASTDQLKAQITDTPALAGRTLLVVLTTNAPETEVLRSFTRHDFIAKKVSSVHMDDASPDLYESWELPSVAFDRLLVRLSGKLPLDAKGALHGTVVLLSGDVHASFATRLKYRATKRFEDTTAHPASVIFAQLVASSFKKQNGETRDMHRDGYDYRPAPGTSLLIPAPLTEGYVGFNLPSGSAVAEKQTPVTGHGMGTSTLVWVPFKKGANPTILLAGAKFDPDPKVIRLVVVPDYRYRLDYLEADREGDQSTTPPLIPAMPAGTTSDLRKTAVGVFNAATGFYRDYNYQGWSKQQIVGLNNISEVTFVQDAGGLKFVNHTVRWNVPATVDFKWVTYNIYVDPNDDVIYPDIVASHEVQP
jgi:hypothetical protein